MTPKPLLLLLTLLLLAPTLTHAAVPGFLTYSGRLTDGAARAPAVNMRVFLYRCGCPSNGDCDESVKCQGSDTDLFFEGLHENVKLVNGYFTIVVGMYDKDGGAHPDPAATALTPKLPLPERLWVTVAVNGAPEMMPRQELGAVPYALRAESLSGVRATTGPLTLWVDDDPPVGEGDDEPRDGSAESPFESLKAALEHVPQIVNHEVKILVKPGIYPGGAVIAGVTGKGEIQIERSDSNVPASQHVIRPGVNEIGLTITNVGIRVNISGMTFDGKDGGQYGVYVKGSHQSRLAGCRVENLRHASQNPRAGVAASYATVYVFQTEFRNNWNAVHAYPMGRYLLSGVSGTGNTYAINASYGSNVMCEHNFTMTAEKGNYVNLAVLNGHCDWRPE